MHELAQKVFHTLKTNPQNFGLEVSQARRRPGRKPQGESRGPYTKLARCGNVNFGVSPKYRPCCFYGPSLKRNTKIDRPFSSKFKP